MRLDYLEVGLALISFLVLGFLLLMLRPERLRDERLERGTPGSDRNLSSFGSIGGSAIWVAGKIKSTRRSRGKVR